MIEVSPYIMVWDYAPLYMYPWRLPHIKWISLTDFFEIANSDINALYLPECKDYVTLYCSFLLQGTHALNVKGERAGKLQMEF